MPRSNDDRPQVTIAGARAGKTSTVLERIYISIRV
jgi:hypothetical protein